MADILRRYDKYNREICWPCGKPLENHEGTIYILCTLRQAGLL